MAARTGGHTGRDDGISLVEVLVSITLLAVTMAATASGVIRSLQVARDSRESVIAANIAQFETERLRSIPFVDWATSARDGAGTGTTTTTQTQTGPDGQTYQVTREATWVAAGADTDGCTSAAAGGGGTGADYVRVRQLISFPGRDIPPVENITVITPRLDFFDTSTGNLAIVVRDRNGVGTGGHVVRAQGLAGSEVATTDSGGCAFFPFLAVDPADPSRNGYDIVIDTPGHVERRQKVQRVVDTVFVAAQTTTVVEYEYDRRVTLDPVPTLATAPAAGCSLTVVTFGPQPTGVDDPSGLAVDPEAPAYRPDRVGLECRDAGGTAQPTGWSATIPHNLAWTIYNPATTFSAVGRATTYERLDHSAVPDTQSRPAAEIGPLFPYANGYSIHAGRCRTADPTRVGAPQRQLVVADPGTDVRPQVQMALASITTRDLLGLPIAGRDVYADMRDSVDCPAGERLYLGRSDATGQLRALLPYGSWVLHWDDPGTGSMLAPALGLVDGLLDLASAGPLSCVLAPSSCTALRADGAGSSGDPAVGYRIDVRAGNRV